MRDIFNKQASSGRLIVTAAMLVLAALMGALAVLPVKAVSRRKSVVNIAANIAAGLCECDRAADFINYPKL